MTLIISFTNCSPELREVTLSRDRITQHHWNIRNIRKSASSFESIVTNTDKTFNHLWNVTKPEFTTGINRRKLRIFVVYTDVGVTVLKKFWSYFKKGKLSSSLNFSGYLYMLYIAYCRCDFQAQVRLFILGFFVYSICFSGQKQASTRSRMHFQWRSFKNRDLGKHVLKRFPFTRVRFNPFSLSTNGFNPIKES